MATKSSVWVKAGTPGTQERDKTRIFKTFRLGNGYWAVDFGSGTFPNGFSDSYPVKSLALLTEKYLNRGDHQPNEIKAMYAKWAKRIEKEGFVFKGTVDY